MASLIETATEYKARIEAGISVEEALRNKTIIDVEVIKKELPTLDGFDHIDDKQELKEFAYNKYGMKLDKKFSLDKMKDKLHKMLRGE
jgi:hypothetical protein